MLRTDLLELINSGGVWAFIGSGASIDAGGPSWQSLIEQTTLCLDTDLQNKIKSDSIFSSAFGKKQFPKCFSRMEYYCGRNDLCSNVKKIFTSLNTPGKMLTLLASWPFKGYITTNYDSLIEKAIHNVGELGWSSVGNTEDEVRKISGNVSKVIWHVHGHTEMTSDKSRLVLTEKDYDDIYLEDSPVIIQLKALMSHTRIVFLGFGFEDVEILRLLKRVGKLTDPSRPVYAFLYKTGDFDSQKAELFNQYNVDIIPYKKVENSHAGLMDLLNFYGAFVIRRTLKFGQPERRCPSYDPEATGLLVYNELCLKGQADVTYDILEMLLVARILVLLSRQSMPIDSLLADLTDKIRAMKRNIAPTEIESFLKITIHKLIKTNNPMITKDQPTNFVRLTPKGSEMVKQHAATAQRLFDQFSSSLHARAQSEFQNNPAAAQRIAKASESFIKDCIDRRSLGIAMLKSSTRDDLHSYHMTALLQSLPEFMAQLASQKEAISLSNVVQGVLSAPSEAEERYIGLCLQARFGVHLLGYDLDTLKTRANELRDTLFLVDSTTIIPFLAISSIGNDSAHRLINGLKSMNSSIASTDLLAEEAAEHARYALKKVENGQGHPTVETLKALTGRAGERSNAFLEGFVVEAAKGKIFDFSSYLSKICGFPNQTTLSNEDIELVLSKDNIHCYKFDEWDGFDQTMFSERDERQLEIAGLRIDRKTYKHERQVKAEAEAVITIKYLRNGIFKVDGNPVSNAFFISHTRIIDELSEYASNITMRPASILQWLATIAPVSVDELRVLTSNLLFELTENNLDIVDKAKLRVIFAPLIDASKKSFDEEVLKHRVLISEKYGEQRSKAFSDIADIDVPIVYESYYAQKSADLERKQVEASKAEMTARISEKERAELEKLRLQEKQRQQKAKKKIRKYASKRKKK